MDPSIGVSAFSLPTPLELTYKSCRFLSLLAKRWWFTSYLYKQLPYSYKADPYHFFCNSLPSYVCADINNMTETVKQIVTNFMRQVLDLCFPIAFGDLALQVCVITHPLVTILVCNILPVESVHAVGCHKGGYPFHPVTSTLCHQTGHLVKEHTGYVRTSPIMTYIIVQELSLNTPRLKKQHRSLAQKKNLKSY